jgi:hypothetical protein
MPEEAIAVVAIVFIFGAPVAAFIVSRVLRHLERIAMIRRGMVPPPDDRRAYREWRRSGGMYPPPGPAAQTPWVQPVQTARAWNGEDDPQRSLFKGIRVALIGFALTVGLGIAFGGYRGNPIILGGLVPMFVGIAQIIIALLSGAQLPGMEPRVTFIPPPSQPPPGPGTPPPPPGYGTATPPPWAQQPGRERYEELSKPVQPPDLR